MRKFLLRLMPVLLVGVGGCNTTYHYAEFIKPSNVYIPAEIYRVGVIDRSNSAEASAPLYTGGLQYGSMKGVPKQTSAKILEILSERLEEVGRFEIVEVTLDLPKGTSKSPAPMLSSETVDSLANAYDVDGFISLDGNEMLIRASGSVDVVTVSDANGMPVRVPEFSKESRVFFTLFWRFYDARSPRVLDEYSRNYERAFTRVAYSEEEINEVRKEDIRISDVAGHAADDYFNRVAPHWVSSYRVYYRSGSPELQEIDKLISEQNDWEQAAIRWKELTNATDAGVRYKARYNMAVASEMLGKPRVAKDWIESALEVKSSRNAEKYLETLKEQILIQEVVNRQLGIEY